MARGWIRRNAPVLLVVAAILWIVAIIIWIIVDPVGGGGSPVG